MKNTKSVATRLFYLRDKINLQKKKDGTSTRGNPIALIASKVDFEAKVITYQVATAYQKTEIDPFNHKSKTYGDTFVKSLGRRIATERLAAKPIKISEANVASGHDIISEIMIDIEYNDNLPYRTRALATDWLEAVPTHKVKVIQ